MLEQQDAVSGGQLDLTAYGFSLGLEQQAGHSWLYGLSVGTTQSRQSSTDSRWDGGTYSSTNLSLYNRFNIQRFYLDLEGGFAQNEQKKPDVDSSQWHLYAETGTWWEQGLAQLKPYLALRYVGWNPDDNQDWDKLSQTTLLAGMQYRWTSKGHFAENHPRLFAGILHEMGDRQLVTVGGFSDSPSVFALPTPSVSDTRFFVGAGNHADFGESLSLSMRYTAELAPNHSAHMLMLSMFWYF